MKSFQKISDTQGNFTGLLDDDDIFAVSTALIGDLDGDGVSDLAAGAQLDDDGGPNRGAVWVLFMNTDGTVKSHQKISDTAGGFTGVLDDSDFFARSSASLGDLDADGVTDLAVGASLDDDGGTDRGAIWVLFLNSDGTVKSHQKISDTGGNFTGVLDDGDSFGHAVTNLGDLDSDGVVDIAVGAGFDDDGVADQGAIWVLFMNANGTVKSHQKISETQGGFGGVLDGGDRFGIVTDALGDVDGDGVVDLVATAEKDDDGGVSRGAAWVLFLNTDGTVKGQQKISDTAGNFTGVLDNGDEFGNGGAGIGDLDGDGVPDLAIGAPFDDDGGSTDRGAVWLLFLNTDGTVKAHEKISNTTIGFTGALDDNDFAVGGEGLEAIGDLDGDGVTDLAFSAQGDDDGGSGRGALYIVFTQIAIPIPVTFAAGNVNNSLSLDWNDVPGAASYRLEYDTNAAFPSAIVETPSASSFQLPTLADATYFWRVKAIAGDATESTFMATDSFVMIPTFSTWVLAALALTMGGYVIWRR